MTSNLSATDVGSGKTSVPIESGVAVGGTAVTVGLGGGGIAVAVGSGDAAIGVLATPTEVVTRSAAVAVDVRVGDATDSTVTGVEAMLPVAVARTTLVAVNVGVACTRDVGTASLTATVTSSARSVGNTAGTGVGVATPLHATANATNNPIPHIRVRSRYMDEDDMAHQQSTRHATARDYAG